MFCSCYWSCWYKYFDCCEKHSHDWIISKINVTVWIYEFNSYEGRNEFMLHLVDGSSKQIRLQLRPRYLNINTTLSVIIYKGTSNSLYLWKQQLLPTWQHQMGTPINSEYKISISNRYPFWRQCNQLCQMHIQHQLQYTHTYILWQYIVQGYWKTSRASLFRSATRTGSV